MTTTKAKSVISLTTFLNDCDKIVSKTVHELVSGAEWEKRYDVYSDSIIANTLPIQMKKLKFYERPPLFLYMNVSEAKKANNSGKFSLRYWGQDVAKLKINKSSILISTSGFDKNNLRDFGCIVQLHDHDWRSTEAAAFRKHFSNGTSRIKAATNKSKEEHRIESLLLTEFAKKSGKNKLLLNIQPVKIAEVARFQMPTPLSASDLKKLKYSGISGGGIDILTRIGKGKATKLCILEVKDENVSTEPPTKAIQQGLVYATFIQQLLRSKSGSKWWKIFGFGGKIPVDLNLHIACVMPSTLSNDTTFASKTITSTSDTFHLHCIYFEEKNNKLINIIPTF